MVKQILTLKENKVPPSCVAAILFHCTIHYTILLARCWTLLMQLQYRVSQKKLHLFLEGCSTPKFWARNKSRGCFGILRFSAFQNCPYFWLLAQLKLRYLRLKTPGVTFRMNTLCNCNTKILYLTMTPGVFNLKYLSFYWVKSQK